MSKTSIEWCDYSYNPVTGCTMGCKNCYARRLVNRFKKKWGYDFTPQLHPERLVKHDNWPAGSRVFVCDMGDLFDPQVKFEWMLKVFEVIYQYPQVTFQILTKQVKRMVEIADRMRCRGFLRKELQSVWWGCTVRNQQEADRNIPELLKLKDLGASVVYISAEPLLGPIDIRKSLHQLCPVCEGTMSVPAYPDGGKPCGNCIGEQGRDPLHLDWVICGGETGPGARPMHPDWARSLRDQAMEAQVPFFFKHNGEFLPIVHERWGSSFLGHGDKDVYWKEDIKQAWHKRAFVNNTTFVRARKKNAGRLLDGEVWNQFPTEGAGR